MVTVLACAMGLPIPLTVFALCMFAANSLFCRMALGEGLVDAASYSTIRMVAGAITLFMIVASRHRSFRQGGDWPSAFLLFLYAVPFSFAYIGLSTGTGALILFGCVQLTMLLSAWRSGERPSLAQWTGLTLGSGGLVYLMLPGLQAPPPLPAALMALAGVAWGLYTLRGRGAGDPLLRTAGNFTRAIPLVLLVSIISYSDLNVQRKGALLATLSGTICSALGYVAWYAALQHLSATRAAVLQLLVPVLAAMAGVVVLAEPYGLRQALASAMVIGGVGLTLQRGRA